MPQEVSLYQHSEKVLVPNAPSKYNDMEQNPLVSVIITTHARSEFLQEAIESVINQTYKNIELIVVDDNADNMKYRKEAKKIVAKFPACKIVENKKNLGGSLTRNEGIKASHGDFIAFLDDDDLYYPIRIEEDVKAYYAHKDENIGIIYGYCDSIDINNKIIGEYKTNLESNVLYQHMRNCLCATSQFFIPRSVFDKVGMFEASPCKQDSIMLVKILGEGYKAICIPKKLTMYRVHNNGKISSGKFENKVKGLYNFHNWCKRYYSQLTLKQIDNIEIAFLDDEMNTCFLYGKKDRVRTLISEYRKYNASAMKIFAQKVRLNVGDFAYKVLQKLRFV